jgi:hypothetical protein
LPLRRKPFLVAVIDIHIPFIGIDIGNQSRYAVNDSAQMGFTIGQVKSFFVELTANF